MLHTLLLHALAVQARKNLYPVSISVGGLPEATTKETSLQPGDSFQHERRDNTTATVDWGTMPNDSIACNTPESNDLPCPAWEGTCFVDGKATPCLTYPLDCYCNLPLQLGCSWNSTNTWFDWMLVEDWFQRQCPSVQPVNFTQIPSCASQCVQDAAFYSGCVTSGRNCFCYQESFFGCGGDCGDSDMNVTYAWYMNECNVTFENAELIVGGNTSLAKGALGTATNNSEIHWYEGIAIATGGLSIVLLVVGWILHPIMRQNIRRRNAKTHAE